MGIAPSHRFARALVGLSASLALVVGAFAAYGFASYVGAGDVGTQRWTEPDEERDQQDPAVGPCVENVCNYLLLGSDSRKGLTPEELVQFGDDEHIGGTRADTIMLVQLDPEREKAVVLSFPRDLWVEIPGRGWDKINTSFEGGIAGGGPYRVAKTIHRLTGLTVNHFLYVDLLGFQRVIDTLGGVEMCIPFDVQDPLSALDLQAGCQTLDGRQALAYVRTRKLPCDETAPDLHRIARQQQFLRAVINRLLEPRELARAPGLVEPIVGNLKRDPKLAIADLAYLVGRLRGISTGAVEFRAVPAVPDTILPPGFSTEISILRPDPSAQAIFRALRTGSALPEVGTDLVNTPPSPANIVAAVLDDASGEAAERVEDILGESGFDVTPGVVPLDGAGIRVRGPAIVYAHGSLEEAQVTSQYLPGVRLREAELPTGWHVAVVTTPGFEPERLGEGSSAPDCIGS
jgi:LCP family protein required for cell wall assembly